MDKPSEHHPLPGGGPGKVLRQARTDLGLSPEDVALQLHLAARQIVALENDDYKNLPQATYVRGYLRSYALLLGLSPEPLLAAYTATQAHSAPKPAPAAAVKPKAHPEDPIHYAFYGLAGILLVLILLWWWGSSSTPVPESAQQPGEPVVTLDQSPEPATEAPPAPEKPAEKPPEKPLTAPRPAPPPPAPVPQPVVPPPVLGNEARARLILRTEQESWADIRDARDTRLLYETVPAGRVVTLEGVPPFSVFLGNVDGVKMEFNGKAYDPSRHKRGLVARFTLGDGQPTP